MHAQDRNVSILGRFSVDAQLFENDSVDAECFRFIQISVDVAWGAKWRESGMDWRMTTGKSGGRWAFQSVEKHIQLIASVLSTDGTAWP